MPGIALAVCRMMRGMFLTVVDGFDSAKIGLSIATSETEDLSNLIFGPVMQGLEIGEDFTNAPCLAIYNNVVYLFYPNGNSLMYATYSGTGWSTSPSTVPNASLAAGASAVAFNGLLYVFYQGAASSGSCSSGNLWYSVFNGSSWSNPIQAPGVTMANSESTCSPTVVVQGPLAGIPYSSQYASSPSALVYNTQLYVFYQASSSGELWYTVFNGDSWIQNEQAPSVIMTCSPAATVYGNDIYVFFQGSGFDGQLWYATYNGSAWNQQQLSAASNGISASPMAGVYNNNLVVVHQGSGNSTDVYYLYYNGSSWSSDTELMPVSLACSPGPVVFNSELYVFMQDRNQAGQLWYTGSDGDSWSLMNQVSGASMAISPGVAEFNNQLYCFYQGPGVNGEMNYSVCATDWTWSSPAALNTIELSASPTGVYFNNTLLCLYPDDGLLFCSIYDSVESLWSPPFPLPNVYPLGSACAVAYTPPGATAAQLYIFYQGAGANGQVGELWYVTYDPSSGAVSAPAQVSGVNMMGNPSAVVFTPSGSTSPQLYVFYQSSGGCNYSVFDGTTWTAETTGAELVESPSAAVFNNQLYVFYQGPGGGWVASMVFNGTSWTSGTIGNTGITGSPSATVLNSGLYVFHQGQSNNEELWYNVFNGSSWAGDKQLSNVGMSNSPSAVAFNNQLYVFYEGPGNNEQLWYSVMGASGNWGPNTFLHPWGSQSGPALVSYNSVMYCFYESLGQLCYSINPGGSNFWNTQMLVPGVSLTGAPSAVLFNNLFYIFYQSAAGGEMWYVTYDSSTSAWSSPAQVPGVSMTESPSAVVFNNELYVFYQGTAVFSQICYCVFNGTSWAAPAAPPIGGMTGSPSAVVFNNDLYVFYLGGGYGAEGGNGPFYNVFNGSSWTSNTWIPGYPAMSGSPSATAIVDQICVAFQGYGNSGDLFYMTFNGSTWSGAVQVSGVSMAGSPAAAALNNYSWWVVYCNSTGQLSYTICSGQNNWDSQLQPSLPNWGWNYLNSVIPAPVVFNGQLYVFFQGGQSNGTMWYISSSNGTEWNGGTATEVPNTGMSGSPSPVVFNDKLYVFHMGSGQDGKLYCNVMSSDGTWGGDTLLQTSYLGDDVWMWSGDNSEYCLSPSAVVFNGQIYCFYNEGTIGSEGCNGYLYYVTLNGSESLTGGTIDVTSPWIEFPDTQETFVYMSPAAVVYNNQIYVFWQMSTLMDSNKGTTQLFYTTSPDGVSWSDMTQAGSGGAKAGSNVLAVLGNQVQAIVSPFVSSYLVPDNLLNTAIIKEKEGGGWEWVTTSIWFTASA